MGPAALTWALVPTTKRPPLTASKDRMRLVTSAAAAVACFDEAGGSSGIVDVRNTPIWPVVLTMTKSGSKPTSIPRLFTPLPV